MAGSIDKTRPEFTGMRSFVGTGVSTFPDILEEQKDLRQMMQDMINEALANVVGATVIQDVPDQIQYNFIGGGISRNELESMMAYIQDEYDERLDSLKSLIYNLYYELIDLIDDLQRQINDLQSGTGSGASVFCGVYLGTPQQNLTDTVLATVLLDTVAVDTHSMFDADNNRILISVDGRYLVTYFVEWACKVVNVEYVVVVKNKALPVMIDVIVPHIVPETYYRTMVRTLDLVIGDHLTLYVWPNGTGDSTSDVNSGTRLEVTLLKAK